MSFDLRYPVGLMFSIFGLILIALGFTVSPESIEHSLGINMDLWWGLVLLVFGAAMFFSAYRTRTPRR